MQFEFDMSVVMGGLITILLSLIAYFIKQLHTDFKRVERDLVEVKATTQIIKTEFRSNFELISQHVEFLDQRLTKLENLNNQNYEHFRKRIYNEGTANHASA